MFKLLSTLNDLRLIQSIIFHLYIQMPFPGYAPPAYTATDVIHDPDWTDIDILE